MRPWWSVALAVCLLLVASLSGCSREEPRTRVAEPAASRLPAPGTAGPGAAEATSALDSGVASPTATSLPQPTPLPELYVVQRGDTLSAIAARFGVAVNALVRANGIADPNAIQVGQRLKIPTVQVDTGPSTVLLPDSEFVNGPAYVDLDVGAFCQQQGGYLSAYSERVDGQVLSGAEIIKRTAHHYSVGPRLLLAVLELKSGWVTNPVPSADALANPLGAGSGGGSFNQQLARAADRLNQGYYDWRDRGGTTITWADGTATRGAPTLNAATAGLQRYFARNAGREQWEILVGDGPQSFLATYRRLFGDPAQYAIEPLIPPGTQPPQLALPWSRDEMWLYTGGPHGGWGDGSGWAALDFVPDEGYLGCQPAQAWATAAAPGLVIYSQEGEVLIDLDGDGREETGWVLFYLHVGSDGRVEQGERVRVGDRIGHPSCEGGYTEASHLHIARRFNGEWVAADGPLPLVLSGWQAHSAGTAYDGTLTRGSELRTACECSKADLNGIKH